AAALAIVAASTPLAAQDSTAALRSFARAARTYRTAKSVQATFTQTLTNPRTGSSTTARGSFAQRGVRRFAFRFTEPAGEAIVADGEALWVYLPSSMKGQVLKLPPGSPMGLDAIVAVLTDPGGQFVAKELGADTTVARSASRFELTPRPGKATSFARAWVWVDTRRATLVQFETEELGGIRRRVRFDRIRFNEAVADGVLRFVPPAGVRIVDQAAMLRPD
ncbi:MAG: outer-membrane lipoprotein carrier protein LolA, partial [Gemmatimonadaceae bacterium]|nr:outer-membrane lipoprotein carrier protein LolA [Gemmatimonadaceae bacterium]